MIEKGQSIVVPIFAIQRDAQYYPDPEKFDPSRFESDEARHNMSWLPFGEGPRNCIGLRFGMMQARIGLLTLLNNFEVSLCSKTKIPLDFEPHPLMLTPKGGIYLKFKAVN